MCVSSEPADFHNTTLVVSVARHPETNRLVHVLTYRNKAVNLAGNRPNAMILHFPAQHMGQENIVDTSPFPGYVDDIVSAVRPPTRSLSVRSRDEDLDMEAVVFDHGIYTVVLAPHAGLVADALPRVPEEKRPQFNRELFEWYGHMWPNWPLALCCFNNRDAVDADPMLWWYEPLYRHQFFAPAVDCHTGNVPDLQSPVDVDHWVIAGGKIEHPGLRPVHYQQEEKIPPFARALLPDWVVGQRFRGNMVNGDFIIPASQPSVINRGVIQ